MKIHRMEQYSSEWWEVRRGLPTASVANKILTPTGKLSSSSRALRCELIADSLGLGDPPMEPTEWMQRGTELEPEARRFFEFSTGLPTDPVGFITNDAGTAGASPDALIPWEGPTETYPMAGLEIKCPKPSTQISYLLDGGLPDYYKPQVHWSMAISGLKQWYFLSYHPELDPLQVLVQWDKYTDKICLAIDAFVINQLTAMEKLGIKHKSQENEA